MKINYVTIANDDLGSFRYHIKTPSIQLAKLGHQVIISEFPQPDFEIYIFHKHLRRQEIEIAENLKIRQKECKILYIVCDYHLEGEYSNHYKKMMTLSDYVVVCTYKMKELIKDECGIDSYVIEDPWEVQFDEQFPRFIKKEIYNILWFGSKTNIMPLMSVIGEISNHKLTIVTEMDSGAYSYKGKTFNVIKHSQSVVGEQLLKCDIVFIPQDLSSKQKLVKTHNRLVDSIRTGNFVIASPLPAYNELIDFVFLGSLTNGLSWLENRNELEIRSMISDGQRFISNKFSPDVIGTKWHNFLKFCLL